MEIMRLRLSLRERFFDIKRIIDEYSNSYVNTHTDRYLVG